MNGFQKPVHNGWNSHPVSSEAPVSEAPDEATVMSQGTMRIHIVLFLITVVTTGFACCGLASPPP